MSAPPSTGHDRSPVIDVDHHSPEFLADRHRRYAELRAACPVAWNTRYGGFWLVTDYESVAAVAREVDTFSHRYEPGAADGIDHRGIAGVPRPKGTPRQGVAERDGPEHADLRRVLNPWFTPRAVAALRPRAEDLARAALDEVIERGHADLVADYTVPVPAVLTMEVVGLPSDGWRRWADLFHALSSGDRSSPGFREAVGRWQDMRDELVAFAAERRRRPAGDLTSALVGCRLDGRAPTDAEVGEILWNLVAGGMDTTTSLTSWALHHLGTHPDQRARVVADPSLLPSAVEELLRHYCPNETLTRTATRDVELGGRLIRRGDVVMVSWVAANHDPAAFERPDEVQIDRAANSHLAFGLGRHRCIGSHLARMEADVMLREALGRLGDYVVDVERFRPSPGNVIMNTMVSMPVTFTPGPRLSG